MSFSPAPFLNRTILTFWYDTHYYFWGIALSFGFNNYLYILALSVYFNVYIVYISLYLYILLLPFPITQFPTFQHWNNFISSGTKSFFASVEQNELSCLKNWVTLLLFSVIDKIRNIVGKLLENTNGSLHSFYFSFFSTRFFLFINNDIFVIFVTGCFT